MIIYSLPPSLMLVFRFIVAYLILNHGINLPDPGLAGTTCYLENVGLEQNVVMNIPESPCTLSKPLFLVTYNKSNVSFLHLGLQLTMFPFQATYHLQLSDLFWEKLIKVQQGKALFQLNLIVLMDHQRWIMTFFIGFMIINRSMLWCNR